MEDIFSSQNILSEEEAASLFENPIIEEEDHEGAETDSEGENKETQTEETTEVDPESIFGKPESVGSEENNQEEKPSSKGGGTSPSLFSSIAKALKEEGIFPDIEDETVSSIAKAEDFADVVEKQIQARLDERQKRIDEALNLGVQPSAIQQHENAIAYLDKIDESSLDEETEAAENLRKNLIYQDCLNHGWSKERAAKVVERSLTNGTDIEDAKEALASNKEFFKKQYDDLIASARDAENKRKAKEKEQADKLKSSIMSDPKFFGDDLSKADRTKIYDSLIKPVEKDPETGNLLTALQAYEKKNRIDFLRYVGYCFAMTNGFKDFSNLSKRQVKKEVKKGLAALEATLNNTQRDANGNIDFASGVSSESYFNNGFDLDV